MPRSRLPSELPPLLRCILRRRVDLEQVQREVAACRARGENPAATYPFSPYHAAALGNHGEVVQLLEAAGISIASANQAIKLTDKGNQLLGRGRLEVGNKGVLRGSYCGVTAMCIAAELGHAQAARALLAAGASPHAGSLYGSSTPLCRLLGASERLPRSAVIDIAEQLIAADADCDGRVATQLASFSRKLGRKALAQALAQLQAQQEMFGDDIASMAFAGCECDDAVTFRWLLPIMGNWLDSFLEEHPVFSASPAERHADMVQALVTGAVQAGSASVLRVMLEAAATPAGSSSREQQVGGPGTGALAAYMHSHNSRLRAAAAAGGHAAVVELLVEVQLPASWSTAEHAAFPPVFKSATRTLLLAAHRLGRGASTTEAAAAGRRRGRMARAAAADTKGAAPARAATLGALPQEVLLHIVRLAATQPGWAAQEAARLTAAAQR